MDVNLATWTPDKGWAFKTGDNSSASEADWVLYFGARQALEKSAVHSHFKTLSPNAVIMGCSTGGEIMGDEVLDDGIVAAFVRFQNTQLVSFEVDVAGSDNFTAGKNLATTLSDKPGLKHVFLLSDGMMVNGTELVRGIFSRLPAGVTVTGGLAGDGADFKVTTVGLNAQPASGKLVAVGFYGEGFRIGYGSMGGWDTFGPERVITKSEGNVLYELDGQSAVELYKSYLADAFDTPGGALLFPLCIHPPGQPESSSIVRTVLTIDKERNCLTFAGDVPQGYAARLMRGNFDHLIDGANGAAKLATQADGSKWKLAVLVSCIGRKLLMGQRISDETEAVADALDKTPTIGFYSYGEICHHTFTRECNLHNQTMTITLFGEE